MSELIKHPPKIIEGEKIVLKAREAAQAEELYQLIDHSRDHLRTWMPWADLTQSSEDTRSFLKGKEEEWKKGTVFDYTIYKKDTSQIVGSFGLHSLQWSNRVCELGYWIGAKFQGQGFVTEAVAIGEKIAADLGFHRIVITCDRLNIRSQKIPFRSGYRLESTEIDECIDRGKFRDTMNFVKLVNPFIPGRITENLPFGYSVAEVNDEEFKNIVGPLKEKIFDESEMVMWPRDVMSETEKTMLSRLNENYKNNYTLNLILYHNDQLAGWTSGFQDSRESFLMGNSAILIEHRGRGLYSRLLEMVLEIVTKKGFQLIWSTHQMTNNSIIVSKLNRGFKITGINLVDIAGLMVKLTYHTNLTRRQVMDFRIGRIRPSEDLKRILKIK